jgi:serine/threonine protein kinase
MNSFENEIKMTSRMRDEINSVVTMYTYDFNQQKRMGFIVMELGNESLKDRVESLHQMHLRTASNDYDYISAQDRKNIWIQLFNIVSALHRHNVVS